MTKLVSTMELEAVRLLAEPGGGVAAQLHVNVIVELTVIEEGGPSPALGVDTRHLPGRDEEVEDGELAGDSERFNDSSQVLLSRVGLREETPPRSASACV